jgi:hypothetical protein
MNSKNDLLNSCILGTSLIIASSQIYKKNDITTLAEYPITTVFNFGGLTALHSLTTTFVVNLFPEIIRIPACTMIAGLASYNIYNIYKTKLMTESHLEKSKEVSEEVLSLIHI